MILDSNLDGLSQKLGVERNKLVKKVNYEESEGIFELVLDLHNVKIIKNDMFDNLKSLRFLTLINFDFTGLTSNFFSKLSNLKSLNIVKSNSITIENDLFRKLNKLYALQIRLTQLHTLPNDLFRGLKEIERLEIVNNEIQVLHDNIFADLTKLKYLDLSKNKLKVIENGVFKDLDQIATINLSENKLTYFIPNLLIDKTSKNLSRLNLVNNRIELEIIASDYHRATIEDWINQSIIYQIYCSRSYEELIEIVEQLIEENDTENIKRSLIKSILQYGHNLSIDDKNKIIGYLKLIN